MAEKTVLITLILVLFIFSISGCMERLSFNDGIIIYETHPTKAIYNIRYGYLVNCSGTGEHKIKYDCDTPETLQGSIAYDLIYKQDYEIIESANNSFIHWNITGSGNQRYRLGIEAQIIIESFLVSDLNGEEALAIEEIQKLNPDVVKQYCQDQVYKNVSYIEADNMFIKASAQSVINQVESNNSFLVAKGLFKWLKQNTVYKPHITEQSVQTAMETYQHRTGDCDDLSVLYISLCRSVNIPARMISGFLIENLNSTIQTIRHAWVEVFVGENLTENGWIPVECACNASLTSEVHQNFALEDINHLRLFVDDGSNESLNISISPNLKTSYNPNVNVEIEQFEMIEDYSVLESKQLKISGNDYREYITPE